jgi:hypothetical protein
MTPDDLLKLKQELKDRESLLQTRKEELDHHAADLGKAVDTSYTPNPSPNPTSYVASIKSHVPVTLDL